MSIEITDAVLERQLDVNKLPLREGEWVASELRLACRWAMIGYRMAMEDVKKSASTITPSEGPTA